MNFTSSDLVGYFSILLNSPVSADQPIRLTSVQAGAAQSWLRRQGIASKTLGAGKEFTIAQLMEAGAGADDTAASKTLIKPMRSNNYPADASAAPGVGVDVERCENLPAATDYRTHPFYTSHFSSNEIGWCISRRNPAESFGGLWAAKEAARKAFGEVLADASLGDLEIGHGENGVPTFPGCSLSISHTDGLCVAVCVTKAAAPLPRIVSQTPSAVPSTGELPKATRIVVLLASVMSAISLALAIYMFLGR